VAAAETESNRRLILEHYEKRGYSCIGVGRLMEGTSKGSLRLASFRRSEFRFDGNDPPAARRDSRPMDDSTRMQEYRWIIHWHRCATNRTCPAADSGVYPSRSNWLRNPSAYGANGPHT
jgi:hypothetical protein